MEPLAAGKHYNTHSTHSNAIQVHFDPCNELSEQQEITSISSSNLPGF